MQKHSGAINRFQKSAEGTYSRRKLPGHLTDTHAEQRHLTPGGSTSNKSRGERRGRADAGDNASARSVERKTQPRCGRGGGGEGGGGEGRADGKARCCTAGQTRRIKVAKRRVSTGQERRKTNLQRRMHGPLPRRHGGSVGVAFLFSKTHQTKWRKREALARRKKPRWTEERLQYDLFREA